MPSSGIGAVIVRGTAPVHKVNTDHWVRRRGPFGYRYSVPSSWSPIRETATHISSSRPVRGHSRLGPRHRPGQWDSAEAEQALRGAKALSQPLRSGLALTLDPVSAQLPVTWCATTRE